jgi:hypothetical protein
MALATDMRLHPFVSAILGPASSAFFNYFSKKYRFPANPTRTIFSWFTGMIPGKGGMPAQIHFFSPKGFRDRERGGE